MKMSKQRQKARSAFQRPRNVRWRDGDVLYAEKPVAFPTVEVVVIRERPFTRPQAAKQHDG